MTHHAIDLMWYTLTPFALTMAFLVGRIQGANTVLRTQRRLLAEREARYKAKWGNDWW